MFCYVPPPVVWLSSVLLYFHILGAIFWVGSGMFLQFVFVPLLRTVPYEAQHPMMQGIGDRYGRAIAPIGGVTVLLGILRGISTGVLGALTTPYGITWLAAIVLAVLVIVVGARLVGPTAEKLAVAGTRDEVLSLADQITRYGRIEFSGMLLMLALMVAMHAGY